MAHVNTDLKVLAVAVSVTKVSDLCFSRRDSLNFATKFMLTSLLFLPVDRVLYHLVVEGCGGLTAYMTKSTHYFSKLIIN